ncbi:MAG TPA: ATP-binding protein [Candidatus Saccharimonadales bacterium]
MLVSVIILGLYAWSAFISMDELGTALHVSDTVAGMTVATFVAGLVSYFWVPQKYIFWGSFSAYMLLMAMTAALIIGTGHSESPFLALWAVVAIFAGVFSFYGIFPLFAATLVYLVVQFSEDSLTREAIVATVLAGELPLIVSYFIWHVKSSAATSTDRAYRDLASELSQVANKAEVVINAIADGVIAVNSQGVIQLINPAAQQIIGWGKQDALALSYKSVLKLLDKDGNEVTTANDPVANTLATNQQVTTSDLFLLTNSEKRLLVSVNVSPVGQLGSGAIIVFRDVTKEKSEERQQAEFISTASHEMRTPVASIEGYLGLALNPATASIDEKARDFINKAHASAQHLGRLFQDLLDVTKADDGRLSNNPKVVDVVAFTHDIIEGLKPKADEKGLRTLFKPLPDDDRNERRLNPVFYVNVDNDHLREVIGNLIENAIKYTPKGDVVVDIGGDADHVTISVADSGIGIPKEDQAHLFQKFYRVDNTETREIGGTGLGLYLCRRLVETMNGRLWVDSEYKQGSTFYVELPRTSHEDAMQMIETLSTQTETPAIEEVQVQQTPAPTPEAPAIAPATPIPVPAEQPAMPAYEPVAVPAPVAPEPVVTSAPPTPVIPAPLSSRPQQNTPLSAIEQDPRQYIQTRSMDVVVPPRNRN